MRQSAITITYRDLLNLAEEVLKEKQDRYLSAQSRGMTNLEPLTKRHEAAKVLVRMLRKGMPAKQTDFYELFEQVKK